MSRVFKLLLAVIGLAAFSFCVMVYVAVRWGVGPVEWLNEPRTYVRADKAVPGPRHAAAPASRPVKHLYAPTTQSATCQLAVALLAAGDQGSAEHRLLVSLDRARRNREPADEEELFLEAVLIRSRFDTETADGLFRIITKSASDTPHRAAAQYMLRLDQADGELTPDFVSLDELAQEDPTDPLVLWLLGIECRSCHLNIEGLKYYKQLCELWKPGPVLVHQTFANLLEDSGQLEQALAHRIIAVKLEPEPWDYDGLGNTLTALKRWNEADDAYLHSTGLQPENPLYWRNWYCSMRQRGDAAGAEKMALKYVAVERLMTGGPGAVILGSDPGATRLKQTLSDLVEKIMDGDLEAARSMFAGTDANLDLLKAYVDAVTAAKQLRAQLSASFGDQIDQTMPGLDLAMRDTALRDSNSVLFTQGDVIASSSAASPLGFGIDFIQSAGRWKVLTLASAPCRPDLHAARLRDYIATVQEITASVKAGKYKSASDAQHAAVEAEQQLTGH